MVLICRCQSDRKSFTEMLASQNQSIILNSLKGALILDASVCLLIDAMILKPDSSAR